MVAETRASSLQSNVDQPIDILIVNEHRRVEYLYRQFKELAKQPDTAETETEQAKYVNTIIRDIAQHSVTEELVLYPLFEQVIPDGKNIAEHDREEHQQVKEKLYKLDQGQYSGGKAGRESLVDDVFATFKSHADEEERDQLPALRKVMSEADRLQYGAKYLSTKKSTPTHPHPSAPNKPPAEIAAGMAALPMDKARDMTRQFVEE